LHVLFNIVVQTDKLSDGTYVVRQIRQKIENRTLLMFSYGQQRVKGKSEHQCLRKIREKLLNLRMFAAMICVRVSII
jgi:hypothetical protein